MTTFQGSYRAYLAVERHDGTLDRDNDRIACEKALSGRPVVELPRRQGLCRGSPTIMGPSLLPSTGNGRVRKTPLCDTRGDQVGSRVLSTRLVAVAASIVLISSGIVAATTPAAAAKRASSKYLLSKLDRGPEHVRGYDRDRFRHWVDADSDRCDARDEVLIQEAVKRPRVRSGCRLTGGRWRSIYDGDTTRDPSRFDVDHMVPLNEAWQSGAWRWSARKREAFANDIGYRHSLVAVSASSNRSKRDREPHDWLPERKVCRYLAVWVAVKWRWDLRVNGVEQGFLRDGLKDCGWPRVPKPHRPPNIGALVADTPRGGGGSGGGGGGGGACAPGYSPCVPPYPPDVDCSDVDGPIYVTGSDPHGLDADGDGVGCES